MGTPLEKRWTKEMEDRAAELGWEGFSAVEIAGLLNLEFRRGLTKSAVLGKFYRMRLEVDGVAT